MRYIIAFIFIFSTINISFAGGGWPQPKGSGYYKLSENWIRSQYYYSTDGTVLGITTTSIYSTSLYGEYGITDRITGILSAPLFVRSTINNRESSVNGVIEPGDEFQGIGDIDLGVKFGLITGKPIVVSASLILGLPTGKNVGGTSQLLQTGDGEFNQLIRLEASHSFKNAPLYGTLLTGFNNRNSATFAYNAGEEVVQYSDEFQWGGELGWTPNDHWIVALKWLQTVSLKNGGTNGNTGSSSIFGNNVEYFSITPEVAYRVNDKWGLTVSAAGAASGKNILASPIFSFGAFLTM